jgi:hypothetical protein
VSTAREVIATSLDTCTCYPGGFSPASYEGPQEDCSAHGRPSLQAAAIADALAAAGFVVINPTDPEVIERMTDAACLAMNDGVRSSLYRERWAGEVDTVLSAALAALGGDQCHNGHPFVPGEDVDMVAEGRQPDPRWCNTCGEARREEPSDG